MTSQKENARLWFCNDRKGGLNTWGIIAINKNIYPIINLFLQAWILMRRRRIYFFYEEIEVYYKYNT